MNLVPRLGLDLFVPGWSWVWGANTRICASETAGRSRVKPIRIHLGPMSEMLRTIIEDLLSLERDIVVVGNSRQQHDVLKRARDEGADMLITQSRDDAGDSSLDAILAASPVKILAINQDGKEAAVFNLTRHAIALNGDRKAVLGQAIRNAASSINPMPRSAPWLG